VTLVLSFVIGLVIDVMINNIASRLVAKGTEDGGRNGRGFRAWIATISWVGDLL
jgi:hypothetical protein